jgi:hypothetical protein
MQALFSLWESIPQYLIPCIEDSLGGLSEKEAEFVRVAELADVDGLIRKYGWKGNGRKPHYRKSIVLAFIAKPIWNFPTTKALIDCLRSGGTLRRLCGWERARDVPSESTFSRAFEEFAKDELPSRIHEAMVKAYAKRDGGEGKQIEHISYDSTAIKCREKPEKKEEKKPSQKKKRGRKRKGGAREEEIDPKRLELQPGRGLAENLADLPAACDKGTKTNSRGYSEPWRGRKLHLAVADGGIPICAILTSASLHDSQAIIPLMQMGGDRAASRYDLADAAYCAEAIRGYSRSLGHVPIIDRNPRGGKKIEMSGWEAERYKERSTVERAFSEMKDNYGASFARVRGAKKVMAHLMFGIIALAASKLWLMLGKEAGQAAMRLPLARAA